MNRISDKKMSPLSPRYEKTICRSLVNGFLSIYVEMLCGIRLGCPMAIQQFFALDSAYKECGIQEDIGGVLFQTAGSTATIVVSGYADYTAIISANTVTCRK